MNATIGESRKTLPDGRDISLVSFFIKNLAIEFSAGLAQEILDESAVAAAKRLWPEEPIQLLKPSSSTPHILSTQFVCMGEFISYTPLPGSQECASSLVIIWYQAGCGPQFEQQALADLSAIDWDGKAKAFSW